MLIFIITLFVSCRKLPNEPEEKIGKTGTILLDSVPQNAAIWVNGSFFGKLTPDSLASVPAGKYEFTFKMEGYMDTTFSVNLSPGTRPFVKILMR